MGEASMGGRASLTDVQARLGRSLRSFLDDNRTEGVGGSRFRPSALCLRDVPGRHEREEVGCNA